MRRHRSQASLSRIARRATGHQVPRNRASSRSRHSWIEQGGPNTWGLRHPPIVILHEHRLDRVAVHRKGIARVGAGSTPRHISRPRARSASAGRTGRGEANGNIRPASSPTGVVVVFLVFHHMLVHLSGKHDARNGHLKPSPRTTFAHLRRTYELQPRHFDVRLVNQPPLYHQPHPAGRSQSLKRLVSRAS